MAKDAYLTLSRRERFELLDAGSRAAGLAPAILEKDYWVCRVLGILFALPDLGQHLVFKGGTSLSKVFRVIERFSEDIDVSFHRDFLGFGENHDPEAASGKEQRRRIDALRDACTQCLRENLLPALKANLSEELPSDDEWLLEIDTHDPQTILFLSAGRIARHFLHSTLRSDRTRSEVGSLAGQPQRPIDPRRGPRPTAWPRNRAGARC